MGDLIVQYLELPLSLVPVSAVEGVFTVAWLHKKKASIVASY
jgi:hypothetical protein